MDSLEVEPKRTDSPILNQTSNFQGSLTSILSNAREEVKETDYDFKVRGASR